MEQIHPELRRSYNRAIKSLGPDPFEGQTIISVDDVLCAHYLIADTFSRDGEPLALIGPKSNHLLLSALGRQITGFGSILKWSTEFEKCASLYFGLIKNHPFHDGNKRTAFLIALFYLYKIRRVLNVKAKEYERLAERTAANELEKYTYFSKFQKKADPEILFIADFFKKNTREVNSRLYFITYNELNRNLHPHGFYLDNPSGNSIDIMKTEEEYRGILRRPRKWPRRVTTIGFPRWTAQVSTKDMRKVLRETKLTMENFVDSEVFFKGAESMQDLIYQFHGPLKRLRDK